MCVCVYNRESEMAIICLRWHFFGVLSELDRDEHIP